MANKSQAVTTKTEPKIIKEPAARQNDNAESTMLPFYKIAGCPIQSQADIIKSDNLQPGQKQALTKDMAKVKGNHALQRMLHPPEAQEETGKKNGKKAAVVQRALSEEQQKYYEDQHGDEIINAVKGDVGSWQAFRQSPTSWGNRPEISNAAGATAPSALSTLYTQAEPAVRQQIVQQLGAGSFRYLTEMASFIEGYRLLCGVIPGVSYQAAGHIYEMTQKDSWTDKIPFYPINSLQVKYSNNFGWSWTKELTGSTLKMSVDIEYGYTPGGGGGKDGGEKGGGISLEKGPAGGGKGKGGFMPGLPYPWPSRIGISTKAKADSPAGYWGFDDLPGPLALANGPSFSGGLPFVGAKLFSSGGVITLAGGGSSPPGGLAFTIDAMDLDVGEVLDTKNIEAGDNPTEIEGGKLKMKNMKQPSIKATLVEGAVGGVVGGDVTGMEAPELLPQAVPEQKTFKYAISGFETGSADTPITEAECAGVIQQFEKDIAGEVANFQAIEEFIVEAGAEPVYSIDVQVQGFASRKWQGSLNDADRIQKNLELSAKRANDVKQILEGLIQTENTTFSAEGKGSAMYLPISGAANYNEISGRWEEGIQGGIVVPEGDTEAIDKWREKRREQIRREFHYSSLPPDQQATTDQQIEDILKDEEKNLNRSTSDVPGARVVGVIVTWNGYKIEWDT